MKWGERRNALQTERAARGVVTVVAVVASLMATGCTRNPSGAEALELVQRQFSEKQGIQKLKMYAGCLITNHVIELAPEPERARLTAEGQTYFAALEVLGPSERRPGELEIALDLVERPKVTIVGVTSIVPLKAMALEIKLGDTTTRIMAWRRILFSYKIDYGALSGRPWLYDAKCSATGALGGEGPPPQGTAEYNLPVGYVPDGSRWIAFNGEPPRDANELK
jgi:hypothetical protein